MADINNYELEGKYSLESTDPRESEIRAPPQLTIALKVSYYLFVIAKLFKIKDGCLKFVYIGKNPRFTAAPQKNTYLFTTCICISVQIFTGGFSCE